MRIRVYHETSYRFETAVRGLLQVLRMTPRNFEGQHAANWRIDVDMDCRLTSAEDAFGNIIHEFSAEGPVTQFKIIVEGEVETSDMAGVVRGARENFPPELFLRSTELTHPNEAITAYLAKTTAKATDQLGRLHAWLAACHEKISFDPNANTLSAQESLDARSANAASLAHLFIAGCRSLGTPARCISGYLLRSEPVGPQSLHMWAEAYVEGLGWIGFDPASGLCPSDRHIRLACALDELGAKPVRASHALTREQQQTNLRVVESQAQRQWQS